MPRSTLENLMSKARELLQQDFVPMHLGLSHMMRAEIANRNLLIPNGLFGGINENGERLPIVIVDGHTVGKVWEDTTVKSRKQAFLEGLSTGAKNPTSKGTSDYHESMNAAKFENWFKEMLPRLEPNAVVVMDNASYHSRRKENTPVTSWNKTNIQKWLTSKKITYEPKETKVQLLEKVKGVKTEYKSYVIDEMAKEVGVEVFRLPPYHCELNPIELVWADVKGYVARNNTTFKMVDV
nr:uncharacterized protein LOC110382585 [Helicoverpa armigera]